MSDSFNITDKDIAELIEGMRETKKFSPGELDRAEDCLKKMRTMDDRFEDPEDKKYGVLALVTDALAMIANPMNIALALKIAKVVEEQEGGKISS